MRLVAPAEMTRTALRLWRPGRARLPGPLNRAAVLLRRTVSRPVLTFVVGPMARGQVRAGCGDGPSGLGELADDLTVGGKHLFDRPALNPRQRLDHVECAIHPYRA